MIPKISKPEIFIISTTFILAFLVIGVFWNLNRGEIPAYTSKQPPPLNNSVTPSDSPNPEDPEEITNPLQAEESSIHHKGLAKLTAPTTVKTLVLGDEVAESQGASKRDELSWHVLVSNALRDKYPGNFQWLFKTTPEAVITNISAFTPEVTEDIDLIILCLGRNDWATSTTDDFRQKYDQLLAELKVKSPTASIFLVAEPPVKNTGNNNQAFPYRQVIINLGKKHQLPVIDGWTAFIKDPAPLAELLADGVNPNDKGYSIFAKEVINAFNEHLSVKY